MKAKYLLVFSLLTALAAFAVEVDGIAARVGSSVILKSAVLGEMRRAGVGEEKYAEVRGEMIERELILKAAARAKLQMQDWVVENRVREIVTRMFGGDANRFKAALARDRVTFPEWRQRVKDDMVVSAMRWQTVDKTVSANPADMRREYESHPERYMTGNRVTVSAILIGPGDADKKPEIEEALKTEPFAEVAKKYSSDARAKDGGQWKDIKPEDEFRPEVCAEIAKMKKDLRGGLRRCRIQCPQGRGRPPLPRVDRPPQGRDLYQGLLILRVQKLVSTGFGAATADRA